MIEYINKKKFKELIHQLPETRTLNLSVESSYDGNEYVWKFAYVDFNGGTYLYTNGYLNTGVIQDDYINSFDEQLEDIWNEIIESDDKPFIRTD